MGKKFGLGALFTAATVGAIGGIVYYLAKNDKFSEETQDNYEDMLDSAKDFGKGVQRAYTSIGNKKMFQKASKSLGSKTKNLLNIAGDVCQSGANDAYNYIRNEIVSKNHILDDEIEEIPETVKKVVKKTVKKTLKKNKK